MIVLGIESTCDECSVALVEDGRRILSLVIDSQVDIHREFHGVVPEIASRRHVQTILPVYRQALKEAGLQAKDIQGLAVSRQPGLGGSLQVGMGFCKGLAFSLGLPFVGVDHVLGHLYAPHLEADIAYPYLGLLVSGGHSMICHIRGHDQVEVLGASIDDAAGEAFDKVARHYGLGYPGGAALDALARQGNPEAFRFPFSNLYKGNHPYDVSYSGLKNAVINQLDQFWDGTSERSLENIAASFERVAIDTLVRRLARALADTGLVRVVAGGGVAANTRLRASLKALPGIQAFYPSLRLCGDNAAMIAGLGYQYLVRGRTSGWDESVCARVRDFRRFYP